MGCLSFNQALVTSVASQCLLQATVVIKECAHKHSLLWSNYYHRSLKGKPLAY